MARKIRSQKPSVKIAKNAKNPRYCWNSIYLYYKRQN